MRRLSTATAVFCTALVSVVLSWSAHADDWNRKSTITFNGPVEIPGLHLAGWKVLPAGTYVFKVVDSQADRHIVQIFNKDETIVYATALTIPNFRLQATGQSAITFSEKATGKPEALRAWFYPGINWGEEFVYPKAKAIELAKETHVPVLSTPLDLDLELPASIRLDAPVVAKLKQAPVNAIQPTGQEVQLAQVVTPLPAAVEISAKTLPATASSLPMVGLFGVLALCAASLIRRNERRPIALRVIERRSAKDSF